MYIVVTIFVTIAVLGFAVGLYFLRAKLLRGSARQKSKRQHIERERERDRRACLSAAMSLDSGAAPREAFAIPGAAGASVSDDADTQSLRTAVENRRREATSTDFDRDMPIA